MKIFKRLNSMPITFRATVWFTFCNFVLKGISFVCMPLYTRIMPAVEYGKLSVWTSYMNVFAIFATFEIYLGAHQRGLLKYKDDIKIFESTIVFISNVLTVLCFAIVYCFRQRFFSFTGIPIWLFGFMSLYFLLFAPYNCWLNRKRFNLEYKQAVVGVIVMSILADLFPILLLIVYKKTAFVKITTSLIISSCFCLPFWLKIFHPIQLIKCRNRVKEYVLYAIRFQGPLFFHSLSYYVLNQSDRVMIEKFSDNTKVAFYSVAYSLAAVIIIIQTSLNQVLKPWRYEKLEKKQFFEVRKNSNISVILVGAGIIGFMLVVPEVFKVLFQEQYYEALVCMPPITMGIYFLFLYTIFVDIESYYGKTNYIAYVSTICAILNILLNYIGMKFYSYVICAYTTLLCYAIMSLLHYLSMKRICKKTGIIDLPVDSKFIWIFSTALFVLFVCINFMYDYIYFRYSLFFVLIILICVGKSKLKEVYLILKKAGSCEK